MIRRSTAIAILAVLVAALASPATADPSIGVIFNHDLFTDGGDADGVDDRYLQGTNDFSSNERDLWTQDNHQYFKIKQEADNTGDAGMYKNFSASPNQTYEATADVKLQNVTQNNICDFRARLTIHAYTSVGGTFLGERNAFLCATGTGFQTIQKSYQLPSSTGAVDVHVRANLTNTTAYGTVVVDRLKFERLN
ncbi:MAG TPA: hypothetical protein VHN37_10430 [Actinomycetota bacterium]|nr:hypothetical protein [Actinomycetota bacterium]